MRAGGGGGGRYTSISLVFALSVAFHLPDFSFPFHLLALLYHFFLTRDNIKSSIWVDMSLNTSKDRNSNYQSIHYIGNVCLNCFWHFTILRCFSTFSNHPGNMCSLTMTTVNLS